MARAFDAPRRSAPGRSVAAGAGLGLAPGMAVGLYGGSFNPVHRGHAHVARTALRRLGLARVIWLVSPGNPLKGPEAAGDLAARLADAARMARGPAMRVSDIERRIGTRYTLDAVRWLKARHPSARFVWIMGADGLADFHRWRGWAALAREVPIAVVSRPGAARRAVFSPMARRFAAFRVPERAAPTLAGRAPPAWTYLTAPFHDISSTRLRQSRRDGPAAFAPDQGDPIC